MEKSVLRRRKILFHFFLGIGLPSLLLGYLAFRGIENDIALLEKERLNEHKTVAREITKLTDDEITVVEAACLDFLEGSQTPQKDTSVSVSIDDLKSEQPLLEEIFLFENNKDVQLPFAQLLYLPAQNLKSSSTDLFPAELLVGRKYEFQQKNSQEALISYQKAYTQAFDPKVRGEALTAIARVQKKSNLITDAIKSYETIVQNYGDVRIGGGLPSGLIAQLELGNLYLTTEKKDKALRTLTNLYRDMINRRWTLDKSQYEFFVREIDDGINKIRSKDDSLQFNQSSLLALQTQEKKERELTERLLTFQQNAVPNLQAKVLRIMERTREKEGKRFTLDIGEYSYLVSILDDRKQDRSQALETWGLLLDSERFKTNFLQPLIREHVSSEGIHWIVRSADGEVILGSNTFESSPQTAKVNFIGNFPPWSLEFYQQNPPLLKTLLTSHRGVYLYMFILLAGILTFGLTLMIRIINHELELGKMKSDFVSTVSHEFKSPLTSIRQLAEMLQTGRVPSEERRQQYYNVLLEQSERLSLLIGNILDFAKMEEGKKEFEFEMVDINSLLEELILMIQQRVQYEGFSIEAEFEQPLPLIQADRAAISQAITNLVDNAIKYSAGAKKVSVRAFVENQHLIIAVQDFGAGIKPEEKDKIFERFYRGGDELTRTVKGSGLGLTLVKQIVQAHHGSLHVESEPGRGSTFTIKLPIQSTKA